MRRCFEQLHARSQVRISLFTSHLPSSKSGLHAPSAFQKSHFLRQSNAAPQSLFRSNPRRTQLRNVVPAFQSVGPHAIARHGYRTRVSRENRRVTEAQSGSLADLVAQLDSYLPGALTLSHVPESRITIAGEPAFADVLNILLRGRKHGGANILAFMVLNQRRYKAVIQLAEVLLKHLALVANEPFKDELPSNIDWPKELFTKRAGAPLELERSLHVSRRPLGTSLQSLDEGAHEIESGTAMEIIWSSLAELVIASSKQPVDEAKPIMNTVYQVLALIHKMGLVPANIYAHCLPQETSIVQQPPFLHLLNSKILSTLSDAVWHAYQDEVSARSNRGEKSPWNFFPEPPGSPLRTKGRDLGPEVWVEFILWCCIEGGFASTGVHIIKSLREDVDDPWHAVPWPDPGVPPTNWDQKMLQEDHSVKTAHSSGGRLQQGSEHKIISAEVVLALADCLITNLDSEVAFEKSSLHEVQRDLEDILSLLAPRDLPPAYLDYLTVRLLQTERLYDLHQANALRQWASTVRGLRDMQSEAQPQHEPGLTLDFVLDRSELGAGVYHQSLQACTENNLVKKAVDTFTDIQKMVDGNKLQAIGEFLSLSLRPQDGFFTSRLGKGQNEFLDSYGQLPTYKLTSFLDLISSAKLFGLGDWLLFSDDIDGPVLAPSTWGQPSVAASLARYATAKDDFVLLERVFSICAASNRKITVNVLRAFIASYVSLRKWDQAAQLLQELRKADGGGYSPKIVACLAATILRLEVDPKALLQEDSESDLTQAMLMFATVLDGSHDSSPASFRIDQKKSFGQQVGYLLRLVENVADSKLAAAASHFKSRFPLSNESHLSRDTFNMLFAAIVETKGSLESRNIWHLFCKDPRDHGALMESQLHDNGEIMLDEHATVLDDDEFTDSQPDERTDGKFPTPSGPDQAFSNPGTQPEPTALDGPPDDSADSHSAKDSGSPPAYLASVDVDASLALDSFNFVRNQPIQSIDVGSDTAKIPVEAQNAHSNQETVEPTPIVVPDMRTLQILVRQGLSEIVRRKKRGRPYNDLEELIQWAGSFYDALHLAPEDIRTEFRVSLQVPQELRLATEQRRRRGEFRRPREKFRPDVSSQFSKGAFVTRPPGVRRAKEPAVQMLGDPEKEGREHQIQGLKGGSDAVPRFKVRKFGTTVVHKAP